MIVVDDFIRDKKLLDIFSNIDNWRCLIDIANHKTFENIADIEDEHIKKLIDDVSNKFWQDYDDPGEYEYWVNVIAKDGILEWHKDKDEFLARNDKYVYPTIGAVWYGHPSISNIEGGYLEFKRKNNEIERIEPVYNRLVVFDSSKFHRVAPVIEGTRIALSFCMWEKNITAVRRRSKNIGVYGVRI